MKQDNGAFEANVLRLGYVGRQPDDNHITCSKCGESKPASSVHFYQRPERPRGFASRCRKCDLLFRIRRPTSNAAKERARQRYIQRHVPAESRRIQSELRTQGLTECTACKQALPLTSIYFYPNAKKANGFQSTCKTCNRAHARNHAAKRRGDPDARLKLLDEKKRYAKSEKGLNKKRIHSAIYNHKRRQRGLEIAWDWTPADWEQCKLAWKGQCAYCGIAGELTQDHFIPYTDPSCPGTLPTNIVPACIRCNCSKCNHSPYVWCRNPAVIQRILDYFAALPWMLQIA